MKETKARLQIIIAMMTFGTIGLFVKNIQLGASEIALYRALIALVILFFFLMFSGRLTRIGKAKKKLPLLFIAGAAMGFNWILLFTAYNYTSVALSTLAYYFAPTLIMLGSVFIFGERLTRKQLLCFIASTIGLVLLIGVSGSGSNDFIGILYGLGAAILYGTVVLLNKKTSEVDSIVRTWIQFVAAAIVLIPYVYFTTGFHLGGLDTLSIMNTLIIGIVHTSIMYVLYFTALGHLRGQQAAILSYIDPAISVFLSLTFLMESVTLWQLVGGLMILIFAFLNEVNLKKFKKEEGTKPLPEEP